MLETTLELIEANWLVFGAVLLLALALAWWIISRRPAERVRAETPDVLTPGAAPAQRNSALVDAAPAVSFAPPIEWIGVAGVAGVDQQGAARAQQQVQDSRQSGGETDDLTKIKGVGPKLVAMLRTLEIDRYDQIAGWSEADIARIDPQLGPFEGRIVRDDWVGQARYLAAGDVAGFEARFGKV